MDKRAKRRRNRRNKNKNPKNEIKEKHVDLAIKSALEQYKQAEKQ